MRTAIFVAKSTTITIKASSKYDQQALLQPTAVGVARPAVGTYALDAGVYAILSMERLDISGQNVEVQFTASDKDIFPDPPAAPAALGGATLQAVRDFFAELTKGADVTH
jgi:hypothetical protein